ncbi:AAA family ATPase, partial [Campylobacter jejuni]
MKVLDDEREIDFDSLSSGEKQIISIFAKVYLDMDAKCIFIIDEPELSLSVEWQRTFLQDIYESNNIELLLAT